MRSTLLIDGENFKSKLVSVFKAAQVDPPRWDTYDFAGLLHQVVRGMPVERKIFYFGRLKAHPETKWKSLQLIEDQRFLKTHLERTGFTVVMAGRVRGQVESQPSGHKVLVFKEKGVDVKIAVDMMSLTCDRRVDQIILGSSDSDLQPAITEVKRRNVRCVYLGFESLPNKGLSYTTHRTILIRNSEVLRYAFRQLGW